MSVPQTSTVENQSYLILYFSFSFPPWIILPSSFPSVTSPLCSLINFFFLKKKNTESHHSFTVGGDIFHGRDCCTAMKFLFL